MAASRFLAASRFDHLTCYQTYVTCIWQQVDSAAEGYIGDVRLMEPAQQWNSDPEMGPKYIDRSATSWDPYYARWIAQAWGPLLYAIKSAFVRNGSTSVCTLSAKRA